MKHGAKEGQSISLLYLSTGSGHQMAARAVAEALARADSRVRVQAFDPLERLHPIIPRLENLGLALTVRFARGNYDRHWRNGDSPLVGLVSGWRALQRGMPQHREGAVIATHVFPLRMALHLRARQGLDWRIYAVVTDFGLHGYWPVEGVDGYFVGHADLCEALARKGALAERVHASGIPLRLDFETQGAWSPPRGGGPLRVAILAGGLQSGAYTNTLAWFVALLQALPVQPRQVRISVVAGSREAFRQKVEAEARRSRFEVHTRGIVQDMAGFMRSHDLLIAKPGGLAVAESLACGLPMACLRPGPGQETANAEFLKRHGLFVEAFAPEQAAQAIARAIREPEWLAAQRSRACDLGQPGAARVAAQRVLEALP